MHVLNSHYQYLKLIIGNNNFFAGLSFKMKVLLVFVVTLGMMSQQLCDCFEDSFPGKGGRQPAYLSVPRFQDCLGKEQRDTAFFWCLPAAKPAKCLPGSWHKLVTDPTFGRC
jgi:hypothetical protein